MGNLIRQLRHHDWVLCSTIAGNSYWLCEACGLETLARDFAANCAGA